jgi:TP901 family phage tail tape measure protein
MSTLMEAVVGLRPDIEGFEKEATKGVEGALGRVQASTEKAGKTMTKTATVPLMALGAAGISAFNSVERGLSEVTVQTGATGEELEALHRIVRDVGRTVTVDFETTGAVVGTLNTLLHVTGEELENASKMTLDYARVNRVDAAESASVLGKLMNALDKDASDLVPTMDKLTFAAQKSGIGANELANLIIDAGPAFDMLGFDLDRSIGLFSSFAAAGANPREVVSSLGIVMTRMAKGAGQDVIDLNKELAKTSEALAKDQDALLVAEMKLAEMREKGDKVSGSALLAQQQKVDGLKKSIDSNSEALRIGNQRFEEMGDAVRSPQEAFELLIKSIEDADELEAIAIASEAFGSRVGAKVAEDIKAGRFEIEEFLGAMEDAPGTLDRVSNESLTAAERMLIMKRSMEESTATIGETLMPVIEQLVGMLVKVADAFNNLSPAQKDMAIKIAAIVAAVGPMLIIFSKLVGAVKVIIGVMKLLNLTMLLNPWALAIAALVAFGVWIYKNREQVGEYIRKIGEWFSGLGEKVGGVFRRIGDTIRSVFQSVVGFVKGIINQLIGMFERVFNGPATAANALIKTANRIPGVNIPTLPTLSIPRLADGGDIRRAGRVMVGEEGPEYLDLPKGARVTPLDKGGTTNITMNVTVQGGNFDEDKLARALDRIARDAAATSTYRRPQ